MKNQLLKIAWIILCFTVSTIAKAQIISTIAGTGVAGYTGDGGPAINAQLNQPIGLAFDTTGNLYIGIFFNNVVRRIDPAGIITTYAGNGTPGYSGDGGPAILAQLHNPSRVATDAQGNVYITESLNHCVRKVDAAGIISTVAGNGTAGYSGDGGPAVSASLNNPRDVAFDAVGNMYITDQVNNVIRKVNTSGNISTYAGTGTAGYSGDGGAAGLAEFDYPLGITSDGADNLYIGELNNQVIRVINAAGIISTFAGNGTAGYTGDGGPAASAQLDGPNDVAIDAAGNFYITDQNNNVIRKVNTSGTISTYAGIGTPGYSGDGGPAISAELNQPKGSVIGPDGNLLIADYANNVIRKVTEPVGMNQLIENKCLVSVYPNPARGTFKINSSQPIDEIKIADVLGRVIYSCSDAQTEKTIEIETNGVYIVTVKSASGIYVQKIIIGR